MRAGFIDGMARRGVFMAVGGDDSRIGDAGDAGDASDAVSEPNTKPDYERDLGVIEAITCVTRSCPSGAVVSVAESALDAIKAGGSDVMKQQAFFVLTALQGWRGERATQVHRSLTRYLAQSQDPAAESVSG